MSFPYVLLTCFKQQRTLAFLARNGSGTLTVTRLTVSDAAHASNQNLFRRSIRRKSVDLAVWKHAALTCNAHGFHLEIAAPEVLANSYLFI